jgi:putative DNA-binding protein
VPAPALRDVQRGFWRALHASDAAPELHAVVLPSATLDPAARVEIYRDMYVWRLREVLREDYPKTHETLGDEFADLARRYLAAHPSTNPSVRHLGRHLPAFLATDVATRARPWLVDLARLELARTDAFDAPDAPTLSVDDLRAVPPVAWADLGFAIVPGVEVLRCAWPAHEAWSAPAVDALAARPTTLRVWRHDHRVFHAAIDRVDDDAFAAAAVGRPFAAICEIVAEHDGADDAPARAGALLARWVEDGLLRAPST